MSNTIKIVHMCDHVVPETEYNSEVNTFLSGTEVCQISENPIHIIDRIERISAKAELPAGKNVFSIGNRLKIDDFSYKIGIDSFSSPTEFYKGKVFDTDGDFIDLRGIIYGMAFEDGFMFEKSSLSPHLQCTAVAGAMSLETPLGLPDLTTITGNGTSDTFYFTKVVYLTNFTDIHLYAKFYVDDGCSSFKVSLTVPEWFDEVVFEETNLTSAIGPAVVVVSKKISIAECDNFIKIIGGEDAYIKVSATFSSSAQANGKKVKMVTVPPSMPCIMSISGTGYEHLSEKDLQYIFSEVGNRLMDTYVPEIKQGRSIFLKWIPYFGGQFIYQDEEIIDFEEGSSTVDPETGLFIYNSNRVVLHVARLTGSATYQISNNFNYASIVYWLDSIGDCIGVSRGPIVVSPENTVEAYVASDIGQGYTEGLRYRMALNGDINIDTLIEGNIVNTGEEGLSLYGIPFGKKDSYDISTTVLSKRVGIKALEEADIIDLYTGYSDCDIVTIAPFQGCAGFTTLEKEFKTFSWVAPERSGVNVSNFEVPTDCMYHYSDPSSGSVKIIVKKGMAVNLTDAKIKLSGIYFIYELKESIETADYEFMLENFDFTRIGQEAIKWDVSSKWRTTAGVELTAFVETKKSINRRYDEYSCPRCNGNGWYVSTNADASKSVESVTGVDKMVQDFLKILLTDIRYYKPGTAFITLKGFVKRDQRVEDLIVLYIKDAEMQLRQLQYNMSIAGSEISEYEELKTVIIESIDATSSQDRIYVEIRLVNMASEYTTIGLAV